MKTNTPREIATYIALYLTIAFGIVLLPVMFYSQAGWVAWLFFGLALLIAFIVGLVIANMAIERFVHQKIKLIYKTIHRLKTQNNPKNLTIDYSTDVLSEVNKEVLEWAKDNREEIAQLKKQEEFRKEFIGNLSHELKTPIFSIQGYLLTLLEGGLEDPSINREYLARADKNLDRLINLINELDMITRLESGQTHLELEKVDLVEITRDLFGALEYRAHQKGITFKFKENHTKPIWVMADRGKITQVITNLLVNSIKYGRESGVTQVRFYDMDENILVEIEDNGTGIAQEHLPRLFERFYRVDKSRNRHQGGSGLGLAIVKHIIDAHGQSINVRSTEGEGSTFSFTLKKA
ncbi:MAG: two-component sensor histidine kinase [Crocinitomicaceae bacterium]|nr:two-component sensor histidine kinase [Crocinitomicaceae bacterium]|tara:strand:+ start:449 stop:1498 length:1050 start_codon:yes stop_codon:yes gene_type:complete